MELECRGCGASLRVETHHLTAKCPYCASPSVVERPPQPGRPDPTFALGFSMTIDYATQTTHPDFELECRCGSAICRGTVTGVDWTDPDWRQRYGSHVVPAVRQAIAKWGHRRS